MNRQEVRAVLALATVFSVRLLGLFMIYPVFATYAWQLHGASPARMGEHLQNALLFVESANRCPPGVDAASAGGRGSRRLDQKRNCAGSTGRSNFERGS